jgi:hypothetical protein
MDLPDFDDQGNLPPEIFRGTLAEIEEHFGSSPSERITMFTRLIRIYEIAKGTGHLKRFVIFGSFVTAKANPNDVDIYIIMDDDFDVSQVEASAAILFDHLAAQSHFGASVFWVRSIGALGGEDASIRDWMLTREGTNRGIIEITD